MNIVSPVQHVHSQIKPNHVLIGKKKNIYTERNFIFAKILRELLNTIQRVECTLAIFSVT